MSFLILWCFLTCFVLNSVLKSHYCWYVLPIELGGVRVRVIDSCRPCHWLHPHQTISFPSHGFCFWHMQFYKAKSWCSFMQLLQLQLSFTVSSFTLCSNLLSSSVPAHCSCMMPDSQTCLADQSYWKWILQFNFWNIIHGSWEENHKEENQRRVTFIIAFLTFFNDSVTTYNVLQIIS